MSFLLQPWHLMFFVFAGWANREQQEVIEYLRTENQVLKEKLGNQYLEHYHAERCHQGLENNLIVPMERPPDVNAEVETTERLGGLLRSYRRAA